MKADGTTHATATSDLQLVSVNPVVTLNELNNDGIHLLGGVFAVTGGDDTIDPANTSLTSGSDGKINLTKLGTGTYTVEETTVPAGYMQTAKVKFTFKINGDGTTTDLTETESPNLGIVNTTQGAGGILDGGVFSGSGTAATLNPKMIVYNVKNITQLAITGGFYTWLMAFLAAVLLVIVAGAVSIRRRRNAAC